MGNIAKAFAKQTLLYWAPIIGGSGITYEDPVEFKGAYIGNAELGDGGPGSSVHSASGKRDNMVLFYMLAPREDGYVCWNKRLTDLQGESLVSVPPDQIEGTHKIRSVTEYVMPGTVTVSLKTQAFIASVM